MREDFDRFRKNNESQKKCVWNSTGAKLIDAENECDIDDDCSPRKVFEEL